MNKKKTSFLNLKRLNSDAKTRGAKFSFYRNTAFKIQNKESRKRERLRTQSSQRQPLCLFWPHDADVGSMVSSCLVPVALTAALTTNDGTSSIFTLLWLFVRFVRFSNWHKMTQWNGAFNEVADPEANPEAPVHLIITACVYCRVVQCERVV